MYRFIDESFFEAALCFPGRDIFTALFKATFYTEVSFSKKSFNVTSVTYYSARWCLHTVPGRLTLDTYRQHLQDEGKKKCNCSPFFFSKEYIYKTNSFIPLSLCGWHGFSLMYQHAHKSTVSYGWIVQFFFLSTSLDWEWSDIILERAAFQMFIIRLIKLRNTKKMLCEIKKAKSIFNLKGSLTG